MPEIIEDIESSEAREFAKQKLEKLMSDDFTDFGIRMMHITEYEKMMKEKKWMSKEIFWHGTNGEYYQYPSDRKHEKSHTFSEFLKTAIDEGWTEASLKMTMWGGDLGAGSTALVGYEDMMRKLKEAHRIESKSGSEEIRQRTLRRLSETIRGVISMGLPGINRMFKNGTYSKENLKPDGETVVPVDLLNKQRTAMQKLLDDPENVTNEELRLIYDESIRGYPGEEIFNIWDNVASFARLRPYQVAVVFDQKAFEKPNPQQIIPGVAETSWGYLNDNLDISFDAGECILGSIALLPNKGLENDILANAKKDTSWAHPVIRSGGNVLWPK